MRYACKEKPLLTALVSSDLEVRTDTGLLSEKAESSSSKFPVLLRRQDEAGWEKLTKTYEQSIPIGNFTSKQNKIHQLEE